MALMYNGIATYETRVLKTCDYFLGQVVRDGWVVGVGRLLPAEGRLCVGHDYDCALYLLV